MRLTNRLGLSSAWVSAARGNYVKRGDFSVTELIAPAQQGILKARYSDDIEEDVEDCVWRLFGNGVHLVLEQSSMGDAFAELKLSINVAGKEVTGTLDSLDPTAEEKHYDMNDFKVTSAWSAKYGLKPEHEAQANLYRYMGEHQYDIIIDDMRIELLLRDWKKSDALRDRQYPQHSMIIQPVPKWSDEKCEKWLMDRVRERTDALQKADENLPHCSSSDRWEKDSGWAVVSTNEKSKGRAVSGGGKCKTKEDAKAFLAKRIATRTSKKTKPIVDARVIFRTGVSPRCEDYCPVKGMCHQYREVIKPGLPF